MGSDDDCNGAQQPAASSERSNRVILLVIRDGRPASRSNGPQLRDRARPRRGCCSRRGLRAPCPRDSTGPSGDRDGTAIAVVSAMPLPSNDDALIHSNTDPSTVGDEELVRQLASGDHRALAELYRRHYRMLRLIGRAILRSDADAEDALQEVFLKLGARASQYRPALGTALGWLTIVMRNACIDSIRRRVRTSRHTFEATPVELPRRASDEDGVRGLLQVRAREAVRSLPLVQRTTLSELYWKGRSCSELAGREAVPVGTVKSRAARALANLRAKIEPEGDVRSVGSSLEGVARQRRSRAA
jgi:RNA polymerase sigma-70 factor (ECF subfamily)